MESTPVKNAYYELSPEDCNTLVKLNIFKYKEKIPDTIPISRLNKYKEKIYHTGGNWSFSTEFYIRGYANREKAVCDGEEFEYYGKNYSNHVLRVNFNVDIRLQEFTYNSRTEAFEIHGKTVNLEDRFVTANRETYIWDPPESHCEEGGEMNEILVKDATIFEPANLHLNDILIIKDIVKGKDSSRM